MSLALLLALAVSPQVAPSEADPAPEPPRLGTGRHVYEWTPDWPRLAPGERLGPMHGGLAVDARGRVLVGTDERGILVVEPDGTIAGSICEELGAGVHSMALVAVPDEAGGDVEGGGERELLLLAYLSGEVLAATLDGEIVWRVGLPAASGLYAEDAKRPRYHPTGVALAPGGELFVADGYGKSYVHRFGPDRAYVASFGGPEAETDLGRLRGPHGLALDRRGDAPRLLIADREHSRLVTFDLEGRPLAEYPDDVRRPCAFALDAAGDLAVADLDGRVTILGPAFEPLAQLGENPEPELRGDYEVPPERWRDGAFLAPHAVAWDADGNLYVAEWNRHGRLVKLRRTRASR